MLPCKILKFLLFAAAGLAGLVLLNGCSFHRITRSKNLTYIAPQIPGSDPQRHQLDIYAPAGRKKPRPVLVFIHGGDWVSGDKELYKFLGARLARKGIVAAVINYRLAAGLTYREMAADAASAVGWVNKHIADYGGDPGAIFVAGHSAGGHLGALIALDQKYFDSLRVENPIRGVVLIDAGGLDMYSYLMEHQAGEAKRYLPTFTNRPEEWKAASPLYHLSAGAPPLLIYRGGKTYPSIIKSHQNFLKTLKVYVPQPYYKVQKKLGHIAMIVQFVYSPNRRYREIIRFMQHPDRQPFKTRQSLSSEQAQTGNY
jgi:acetyl esterase/lipase